MKKLFMKGKSFLACVLVFAVLAVSLFTGAVVTAGAATVGKCGGTTVEKWDKVSDGVNIGDWYDGTFESGDGTKDNPYIISSAEELAWVCKNTTVENSAGVYYKVDDSIKAFDMNTVAGVDLTDDSLTATQAKNLVAGKILGKVWHPGYSGCFAGNFDGNGVTIYGLYAGPAYYNQSSYDNNAPYGCEYAGLFSVIDASTATFKNFTIKNSYFTSNISGAVYGRSIVNDGSALIENVVVANCYLETKSDTPGGVMVGKCDFDATNVITSNVLINNCLVYGNVVVNKNGNAARLVGTTEAYCNDGNGGKTRDYNGFSIKNTIAIDCAIENSGSWWQQDSKFFTNCYTTETPHTANTTITKLPNADAAKGVDASSNLIGLDRTVWFFNTSTYPALRVMHNIEETDNENGTHIETCDCGLYSNPVSHNFVNGSCACGAVAKCGEIASSYSGTPDTALKGAGTVDNPYLITSADEFAAVALGKIASTENTYFKVDGIDSFYMNGGVEVANMTSANQVKTYFTSASSLNNWVSSGPFIGNFDGNGVTVYGLYAKRSGQYDYAGLFPIVSGHSSIKNIAIKNSYISSFNKDGSIAALVGGTVWAGDSNSNTSISVENVIVANNYIASTNDTVKSGASVLMGCFFEKHYTTVNNCLIYGNIVENAYTGAGLKSAMITTYNGTSATTKFNNIVSIGVTPWSVVDNKDGTYGSANWYISNVDSGHYTNIYTDQSVAPLQAYNPTNNADKYLEKFNINSLSIDDLKGSAAVEKLTTLGANWIFSATGYPEFRVFHDDELDVDYAADKYAGHVESCSCGFTTPVIEHDYNDNYKCIDCGFVCDHANADVDISGGDCLTAATKTVICSCGYEDASPNGTAAGHTFIYKNEVPSADCLTQGTAAHNYCSVCKKNYAADADVMAAFDTAISDEDLKLPPAAHTALTDNSGIIYNMSENTHSKVCAVCTEEFDTENHVGSFVSDGVNGHKGQCSVCMLDTSDEAAPHNFDGSTCTDCNWTCTDHNYIEGTVKAEGDCTNNRVVATYCSICKVAGDDKVTTASGHVEGEVQTENVVGADCENDGSHDEVIYCTACETELSRTTVTDDKLGHTEGEVQTENVVEADCENDGSHDEVIYCTVCETELSRTNVVDDKLGHTEGEVQTENVVEADCENDGSHDEVVYCTVCEEEISRTTVTDEKLGHELTKVVQVDATYDSVGTKEYYICECGEKFADAEGLTKVTDDELVIDKLVKEENDSTNNDAQTKPEGDTSGKSPATNDGLVSVAMVSVLVGAAFIVTKKFKAR